MNGPSHDTPAELRARSVLNSLIIPYRVYPQFDRKEWRCGNHTKPKQFDIDSVFIFEDKVYCKYCFERGDRIVLRPMTYEPDILAFAIDAIEIDGSSHDQGKQEKNDPRRQRYLEQEYHLKFHRYSNDTIMKHLEEFEQGMRDLQELRVGLVNLPKPQQIKMITPENPVMALIWNEKKTWLSCSERPSRERQD